MSNPSDFYDGLAADYHRMFANWDAAIAWQARIFGALVGGGGQRILDCACGIGTQTLGLAGLGHRVVGTDVSRASVARARREARARGVDAAFAVADMRRPPVADGSFDVVLCADNALCHLLTASDVVAALSRLRRVLRDGGRLVLSVRDYEEARRSRPESTPLQVSTAGGRRSVTFQLWHWHDDAQRYDFEHLQVHESQAGWRTERRSSTLWALTRAEIAGFAAEAGFIGLAWHSAADTGYYQPILTAW